ncbi:hypothetical protein LTR56_024392 [Elasticomyces elasticus]|nr:hypothetical protein LTR56_024392 [Elasticomyces elasticus]KAK3622764.1 hypothetical protein LTR22_024657 [Elasticomyces elasticus]KAK4906832.1 hypothetical protein LTR49_024074 [Elasticomyces elasticus]
MSRQLPHDTTLQAKLGLPGGSAAGDGARVINILWSQSRCLRSNFEPAASAVGPSLPDADTVTTTSQTQTQPATPDSGRGASKPTATTGPAKTAAPVAQADNEDNTSQAIPSPSDCDQGSTVDAAPTTTSSPQETGPANPDTESRATLLFPLYLDMIKDWQWTLKQQPPLIRRERMPAARASFLHTTLMQRMWHLRLRQAIAAVLAKP